MGSANEQWSGLLAIRVTQGPGADAAKIELREIEPDEAVYTYEAEPEVPGADERTRACHGSSGLGTGYLLPTPAALRVTR
jgi:hypothetical protein